MQIAKAPRYASFRTRAFVAGLWATLAMSLLMGAATLTGLSPLPAPVPKALITEVLGAAAPTPLVMLAALVLHFTIGGLGGLAATLGGRSVTYRRAFVVAVGLWLVMQVAVLPFLGWGVFGTAVTPRIAVATFVPHLLYGGVLGWQGREAATTSA